MCAHALCAGLCGEEKPDEEGTPLIDSAFSEHSLTVIVVMSAAVAFGIDGFSSAERKTQNNLQ